MTIHNNFFLHQCTEYIFEQLPTKPFWVWFGFLNCLWIALWEKWSEGHCTWSNYRIDRAQYSHCPSANTNIFIRISSKNISSPFVMSLSCPGCLGRHSKLQPNLHPQDAGVKDLTLGEVCPSVSEILWMKFQRIVCVCASLAVYVYVCISSCMRVYMEQGRETSCYSDHSFPDSQTWSWSWI